MLEFLNPRFIIEAAGVFALLAVLAIVFAESGLLIGFFLPGDSLLFTAGLLASQKILGTETYFFANTGGIWGLSILVAVAAILGDSVGYWFGQRVGPRLFNREDSIWFQKKHLTRAHAFYEKHGGKAIILARFMPIVRTFAPIVAGMAQMTYGKFLAYNIVGGILWGVGLTWAGYLLGSLIRPEEVDKYLLPIIGLILVASVAPPAIHLWRESGDEIMAAIRSRLGRGGPAAAGKD